MCYNHVQKGDVPVKSNKKLVREIISDVKHDMSEEEILNIFAFTAVLIIWMVGNVLLAKRAFDPYPFILLNLVLSCVAAIQAPLIMMSQNRQEEKDRRRAENDYKVNLKTEIMIEDLHDKMNKIIAKQVMLEKLIRDDKNNNDKEE